MKSRSGGAFFAIAQRFMDEYDGVVYGCYFDIGEKVAKHIRIDNSADLSKLQGSKYVQSDSSEGMKQALIDLHNGKKVLFSGTACQVAGIISACPKVEKNNLFTLDIVCRGIPSPGVCTAWLNKKMEVLMMSWFNSIFGINLNSDGRQLRKQFTQTPNSMIVMNMQNYFMDIT